MSRRVWAVSELVRELNRVLEQGFAGLWVEGEVTNCSSSGRGHLYFTLKDDSGALDCVMWSSRAGRLPFRLEDGLAVLVQGAMTIYAQRGRLQLVVEELQPQGQGALQLAFEQLKARLAAEGLFAEERKRALPALPQRVGIVTSATGAALRDMLKVLRRHPHLAVVVAPAQVQGAGAAAQIAEAVRRLGGSGLVEVLVVARGGGSLEDLWAFNEEPVARAIAACPVPVISGVGHETDVTIADFVADLRAATPTHAAELVVAQVEASERRLREAVQRLARDLARHLQLARMRLAGLAGSAGLARLPARLRLLRGRLDRAERLRPALRARLERVQRRLHTAELQLRRVPSRVAAGGHRRLLASHEQRLRQLTRHRLERAAERVRAGERALRHLGPQQVLERGYSITSLEGDGRPLRAAAGVRPGAVLTTQLARGRLRSVTARVEKAERVRQPAALDQAGLFGDDDSTGGTS